MIINNADDVKKIVNTILANIDSDSFIYERLRFFSSVNFTTTTEYYGELNLLLKQIVDMVDVRPYKPDIIQLIELIDEMFRNQVGV